MPARTRAGAFNLRTMTKQEIVTQYNRLDKAGKDRVGRLVNQNLKRAGLDVTRTAVHIWRNTKDSKSPINNFYLNAYRQAFSELLAVQN